MEVTVRIEREELWQWRRAAPVRPGDRLILGGLIGAGLFSTLRFADWWFTPAHVGEPALYVILSLAVWYGLSRMVLGWVNLAAISAAPHVPARAGRSVAIFTTASPGEPVGMFETTLAACARIEHPHTTYLLDDTGDGRLREVAERHDAVWLELVGIPGAKAGKINAALERTDEELILVLDPDHVPFPNFLDRVVGQFDDEAVGFVQVAQAYYNQSRSFTARAAAEQTYAFYGPTQMGLFGHGCAVAIGANCTFRRTALESVGGHGIGLAEDMVTSIRLHGAGWKSVYVPEIVSRGLVPEDIGSFYRQQLKWARGVFEVLFSELPRAFPTLSWRQRLSYLTISTYYVFGATTLMYLVLPYLYLWTGVQPAAMSFAEFVGRGGGVAVVGVVIYRFGQRWLCDPRHEVGLHWRALMLKIACWPVCVAGMLFAVVRAEIPYIPTAKEARRGRFLRLAWPHLLLTAVYLGSVAWVVRHRLLLAPEESLRLTSEAVWGMIGFATWAVLMAGGGIYAAWEATRPPTGFAWDIIEREPITMAEHDAA
ncbi:MAG TPA: glycosyltransferase family 2 protein [Longimicrobiales bacterium]|nr:glycosyltransferase family 2 protein [Longimicrobiales bacterium]